MGLPLYATGGKFFFNFTGFSLAPLLLRMFFSVHKNPGVWTAPRTKEMGSFAGARVQTGCNLSHPCISVIMSYASTNTSSAAVIWSTADGNWSFWRGQRLRYDCHGFRGMFFR